MKKQFILAIAAFLAFGTSLRADTSYLLIQGPFGSGGGTETFKWVVNYQAGTLITGQDLLNDVFGTPTLNGTYSDDFGGTYNLYSVGNSTQGASYIDFGFDPTTLTEPFAVSFTLGSTTVAQATDYSSTWNYYVAGGSGGNGGDKLGGPYANDGSWIYSMDGSYSRTLSNGSFDSWVFGDSATVAGDSNSPTVANFVPEPSSIIALLSGMGVLGVLRRRRS